MSKKHLWKAVDERCDHCKKWIRQCSGCTLEGKVSAGIDISFCICDKCAAKPFGSDYWDKWVINQEAIS